MSENNNLKFHYINGDQAKRNYSIVEQHIKGFNTKLLRRSCSEVEPIMKTLFHNPSTTVVLQKDETVVITPPKMQNLTLRSNHAYRHSHPNMLNCSCGKIFTANIEKNNCNNDYFKTLKSRSYSLKCETISEKKDSFFSINTSKALKLDQKKKRSNSSISMRQNEKIIAEMCPDSFEDLSESLNAHFTEQQFISHCYTCFQTINCTCCNKCNHILFLKHFVSSFL